MIYLDLTNLGKIDVEDVYGSDKISNASTPSYSCLIDFISSTSNMIIYGYSLGHPLLPHLFWQGSGNIIRGGKPLCFGEGTYASVYLRKLHDKVAVEEVLKLHNYIGTKMVSAVDQFIAFVICLIKPQSFW